MFPYRGGPKGFEKSKVDVVFVDERFSTERCCGIIGNANGFGTFDRFCVKKECLVKAHKKSKFFPHKMLSFAPGSGDSAFCCHFTHELGLSGGIKKTSREWIRFIDGRPPGTSIRTQIPSKTHARFIVHPRVPKLYAMEKAVGETHDMTMSTILKVLENEKQHTHNRHAKRILIVTKDRMESCKISKNIVRQKVFFHQNPLGDVFGFVCVCSYNDLLRRSDLSGEDFDMIIPTDILNLKTTTSSAKKTKG